MTDPVQFIPRAYFEAEFGPLDSREHTADIGPRRAQTPAFLAFPELFDDGPEVPLRLRPVDPPPEAA